MLELMLPLAAMLMTFYCIGPIKQIKMAVINEDSSSCPTSANDHCLMTSFNKAKIR